MAAPNSYNFVVTRDQLITDALLHIGAIGEGETPSANAVTESARVLNMLLKLRANEIPVWSKSRGYILPFTEASSIASNSHVVTTYVTTTLSAAEASGQTVVSVTSSTGMTASDQVGIEIDDGTMHWTTISSVDSSTQITIAVATDGAAASGNRVYTYTASTGRVQRPLRVLDANILQVTDNVSWPITVDEYKDYFNLGDRASEGTPNRIMYYPGLGTRAADPTSSTTWYGTFYVHPRFENGDYVIEFTYLEPMQDLDATGDHPYIPQEFYMPVWLELAALLAPRYGVSIEERRSLFSEAEKYRMAALETTQEGGSLFLQPEPMQE